MLRRHNPYTSVMRKAMRIFSARYVLGGVPWDEKKDPLWLKKNANLSQMLGLSI